MRNNIPIAAENFLAEEAVLKVASIVSWKRSRQQYNFKTLPKTAVLTLSSHTISRKTKWLSKKAKGLVGQNYILNDRVILCSEFGNGSPAIVGLMEELRELGVAYFIFVGVAGSILEHSKGHEIFIVGNSFSTTGITAFYAAEDHFEPTKNGWFENLKSKLNLPETTCWSTDAPYRETQSLLSYFTQQKATHVDMECASIYAFASFYGVDAMCVILTADQISDGNWQPPQDTAGMHSNLKSTIKKIIQITNDSAK